MSTRRTTRAGSRAASSRGNSPAATDVSVTSRTSRRSGTSVLPGVGVRETTSYGTGVDSEPLFTGEHSDDVSNVLQGILQPIHEEAAAEPSVISESPYRNSYQGAD